MKFLCRLLFFLSVFVSLLFFSFTHIYAANEFFTSYDVFYEASTQGKIKITQNITLTNKFSNLYATQYSFTLEKVHPENITASGQLGPMEVKMQTEGEKTTITLNFNEQVVGKGKTLKFTLNYEVSDFFHQYGQVRELTLPKLTSAEEIDEYKLTLKVPHNFGKLAYISPSPKSQNMEQSAQYFYFDKEQLTTSGIVAAFGEFQIFDFVLTYHLENTSAERVRTKIAFPPDTNYQKIAYQKINPQPENLEVDADGNWLGTYLLSPKEKFEVLAYGQVKIFALPQYEESFIPSSSEDLTKYLEPQKFWEIEEEIKTIAKKLKTPRQIYNYVVDTLDYDYSRVREGAKRFGALEALNNPKRAICMEYTDLFVALARAAGIPAREINGFAYTDNPLLQPLSLVQDVLHSWPEYWDDKKSTWVQIDPTWQDTTGGIDYFTKLDLGHFVFVIHGQDSQIPAPAGAYKDVRFPKKDIQISFGQFRESEGIAFDIEFQLSKQIPTERPTEGKIIITNFGNEAIYNFTISAQTQNLKLLTNTSTTIAILPPFAHQEIPVKVEALKFFSQGTGKIIVLGNGQQFEYNLTYQSIILKWGLPVLAGFSAFIILLFLARRGLDFFRQRHKDGNKF